MAHEIIATEANLVRQHVPGKPRCLLCGFHYANTTHAIFYCQVSRQCWKKTAWWELLKKLKEHNTLDNLYALHSALTPSDFEFSALTVGEFGLTGVSSLIRTIIRPT